MKITFPHMGNVYIAAKFLLDGLGIDYVIPPLNNKEALEIGTLYSPEEICLPFKIMLGNYIQSIRQGADTVILTGSCGPCRFGEYGELQMKLLNKIGHNLDFIVFDMPSDIGFDELKRRIKKITDASPKKKHEKYMALMNAYKIITLIDDLEAKAHKLAGYEINKGDCKKILNECKKELLRTNNPKRAIEILKEYHIKMDNVQIEKNRNPLKVAIIGEIYTIIEPFSNLYIEDKLMELGVHSKRTLSPSWWFYNTVILSPFGLTAKKIRKSAKDYLPYGVGGHGQECIGESILAHEEGFDGAIQIFPLGCMPEIVSKSILPSVSRDKNFPILSLVVDEMTGEAGYQTRLEAFIDLLERRRNHVLSRS
ncbi:hypothetical protein ABG79_00730 [Caloramator mitchellensis]|uniref:2-hydroxyglutaryl-CoA dehydratase, D-component n=1 Tax=Caloramator mitchellensis TaxID=908809 RepID=A0A0R3JV03_CALMK|nr:hypothetical protein [Caloramator mitchellensis]KRQ87392.1 hypothetical protein ABG79_00730 [Caloramator mitchellensis]